MCDYPFLVIKAGDMLKDGTKAVENVYVPCSRCYNCKISRLRQWVFRLVKHGEVSKSSYFFTLTYSNENCPITKNHFMTLCKEDVQKFMKRLRKYQKRKISYYLVGEYGTKTKRPHYHIIMYDIENPDNVSKAWGLGHVHYGTCTENSIAYSLSYMTVKKRIYQFDGDDRLKEFSLMSKGLGKNYIKPETVEFHRKNWKDLFITTYGGSKISIPKYYKQQLYDDAIRLLQKDYFQDLADDIRNETFRKVSPLQYDLAKGQRAIRDKKVFQNKTF